MKAVVQTGFGNATDVLSLANVDRPTPGSNSLLVRVRAAGVAKGVWLITHGLPYVARPVYGIRSPKEPVAGLQFAGTVEELGDDVSDFSIGDEVFGFAAGSLAEYVVVARDAVAAKPSNVTFEQAAATPVSGITALQAVRDGAGVKEGDRVLVLGASGGVGSFVVQIAKAFGAEVTGVAGAANLEVVRELGADRVIDYRREDPLAGSPTYDAIIDIAGNRPVKRLRKALAPKGALVIVGGTGGRWTMGFERTVGGMLVSPFVSQRIVALLSNPNRSDLEALAALMADGKVIPVVSSTSSLDDTPAAIESIDTSRPPGTPVITI